MAGGNPADPEALAVALGAGSREAILAPEAAGRAALGVVTNAAVATQAANAATVAQGAEADVAAGASP